ncbi:MAG: hypothetical protein WC211_08385 [Dehalococcoidia bacterium]
MATNEHIPLQRAFAVIEADRIAIYPSRAQIVGALIELAIAGLAMTALLTLFDVLPMFVMIALLLVALLLGPIGTLGLVFSIAGTAFVMERGNRAARWQQGFLGMGIGTTDGVPFSRIKAVEAVSDADLLTRSGERQDMVTFEVVIARDDERRTPVASVVSARSLAAEGAERVNRLATVLAEMAAVPAVLAVAPVDEDDWDDEEWDDDEAEEAVETPRTPAEHRRRSRNDRRRTRRRGAR